VSDYDETGFGYLEWGALDRQYGTSIATPAWALAQLQARPGFEILTYWERGWPRRLVLALARVRCLQAWRSRGETLPVELARTTAPCMHA